MLPRLNCNHRNILRRAITHEQECPGTFLVVGKGVSNRNGAYKNALLKLRDFALIEVEENGENVRDWRLKLCVCPQELRTLING
jgi:hypothetical protein